MFRFFTEPCHIQGDAASIHGADARHIGRVLRMHPGEKLLLSTGEDWDYLCEITEITKETIFVRVLEENSDGAELETELFLYQALLKSDKLELVIQKAVELGVSGIIPVVTKRTVTRPEEGKLQTRLKRWQAIAEGAAKQSKRRRIPKVFPPVSYREAIEKAGSADVGIIPYELAFGMGVLRKAWDAYVKKTGGKGRMAILIGPEGGFEEEEIRAAREAGILPVSLGRRILRAETAAMAVLSYMMLKLEELEEEKRDDIF